MDEIDFKIIDLLKQDARMPFTKIAKKIGMGTDSIIRRYKKLLRTGIIGKPTIVLNSKICGFEGCADFFIKLKLGKEVNEILPQLNSIRNLVMITRMLGDADIFCTVFFTDYTNLAELTKNVKSLEPVHSVDVSVYIDYEWPLPISYLSVR